MKVLKKKLDIKNNIEIIFLIVITVLIFLLYFLKIYPSWLFATILLIFDIYYLCKFRNNPFLFFLLLCILYFDYSVVITRYLFNISEFSSIYSTLKYASTKYIGITSLLLMHFVSFYILRKKYDANYNFENVFNETSSKLSRYKSLILYIMLCGVIFIIANNRFLNIVNISESILEYTLIPIIFLVYYFRNNKVLKYFMYVVVIIYAISTIHIGGRITILQPLISIYLIFYAEKFKAKNVIIAFVIGVFAFTVAGLYGDNLEYNTDKFEYTNIKYDIDVMLDRKLALDTSYSAYWTGLTIIETKNRVQTLERYKNFAEYATLYTIGGQGFSSYKKLPELSHKYYIHYYGGFINSYFYFWFGYLGILLIGIALGFFNRNVYTIKKNSSDFRKILLVYYISTLPRWYLYEPSALIRGTLLLCICYFILNIEDIKINRKKFQELINSESKLC